MNDIKAQFGPWAIVTGSWSGIGKGFTEYLAEAGINLVLNARDEKKLHAQADDLTQRYGIQCRVFAFDMLNSNVVSELDKATQGIDIGLLISNAGSTHTGVFSSTPIETHKKHFRLNSEVHLELSHYFINRLLDRQRKGGLLMVSSMSGFVGMPYQASYSGEKAYAICLGEALNYEAKNTGINVTVLAPGATDTPLLHNSGDLALEKMGSAMSVEQCVSEGMDALIQNKNVHVTGRKNRFIVNVLIGRILSRTGAVKLFGRILGRALRTEKAIAVSQSS